jgi:hypothetical protein
MEGYIKAWYILRDACSTSPRPGTVYCADDDPTITHYPPYFNPYA